MIRDLLHHLAHFGDRSTLPCPCALSAYQRGWRTARRREMVEMALRSRGEAVTAEEMHRRLISESERWAA